MKLVDIYKIINRIIKSDKYIGRKQYPENKYYKKHQPIMVIRVHAISMEK